jgi:hypothetical protein
MLLLLLRMPRPWDRRRRRPAARPPQVLLAAGPQGHILNVGHGVVQGTPEENVGLFCELARQSGALFAANKKELVGVH